MDRVRGARTEWRRAGVVDAVGLARGEMGEDAFDDLGSVDARDDAQRPATHPTVRDVDVEDALEPLHPAHGERTSGKGLAGGWTRRVGDDEVAVFEVRGEHAVVSGEMGAGAWYEGSEQGYAVLLNISTRGRRAMEKTLMGIALGAILGLTLTACGGGGGSSVRPDDPGPGPGTRTCPNGQVVPIGDDCPDDPGPGPGRVDPIPPSGQSFRGQATLAAKVTANGRALQGKVFVWDPTYDASNTDPGTHYNGVKQNLRDSGIPDTNIIGTDQLNGLTVGEEDTYPTYRFFNDAEWADELAATRVVVVPAGGLLDEPGASTRIAAGNVLFVKSAGNTPHDGETGQLILARRDWYVPTAPHWAENDVGEWPEGYSSYAEAINSLRTGKAIVAVWADVDDNGNIVPYASSVRCGNAGNSCFTVILPRDLYDSTGHGTSYAAPRLGAAAFYLRQLWDKAEEVTGVLRTCAIDIGAPGVDDEFGAGAVNVDCPTVANKEVQTAAASVSTEARSPALDSMTGLGAAPGEQQPSFSFTTATKPDADSMISAPEIFVSQNWFGIGKRYRFDGGEIVGLMGTGTAPLGVHSRLVATEQSAFFEVGGRKELVRLSDIASLAAVGTLGYDTGGMNARVARAGLQAVQEDGSSSLRLYAGVSRVSGEVGIPGRREVGRDKVPFTKDAPEVRLSYVLQF